MLLNRLITASGTSGKEDEIKTLLLKEIRKYVNDVKEDKFGNIIAHKNGKSHTVMLIAHMDEIGLMVKSIDRKGYIHCSEIGTVEPLTLVGSRVNISTKKGNINGVVTLKSISDDEGTGPVPSVEHLIVDTGLDYEELKEKGVEIGSYVDIQKTVGSLGSKNSSVEKPWMTGLAVTF